MHGDLFSFDVDEFVKQLIENRKKLEEMNEKHSVTIEKEKLEVGLSQRNVFEITKVYFDLLTSGKIKCDVDTTDVIRMIIILSNVFEFNHRDLNENDDTYESTIKEFATKKLLEFYEKDKTEEDKLKFCQELFDKFKWNPDYRLEIHFNKEDKYKVDHMKVYRNNECGNPIFKIMIESCKQ